MGEDGPDPGDLAAPPDDVAVLDPGRRRTIGRAGRNGAPWHAENTYMNVAKLPPAVVSPVRAQEAAAAPAPAPAKAQHGAEPALPAKGPLASNAPTSQRPGNALGIRLQSQQTQGPAEVEPPIVTGRADAIASSVKAALKDGFTGVEARSEELRQLQMAAMMSPAQSAALQIELAVLSTTVGGEPAIAARLVEIDQTFMSAMMSPEQSAALTDEHIALKQVREAFAPLITRIADIERVQQQGAMDPSTAIAYAAERRALQGFVDGKARLQGTTDDATRALQAGGLDAATQRQTGIDVGVLPAVMGGVAGIQARLAQITHTFQVARLLPEAMEDLRIQEKVLGSIERELTAGTAG